LLGSKNEKASSLVLKIERLLAWYQKWRGFVLGPKKNAKGFLLAWKNGRGSCLVPRVEGILAWYQEWKAFKLVSKNGKPSSLVSRMERLQARIFYTGHMHMPVACVGTPWRC
jgi:hypothetical protein